MTLEPDEFESLALEHLDMLYRIARRLTRDVGRAEDLVQETYLRAIRARPHFQLQTFGIRPWLVRILHNLHFSRSARESRQPASTEESQLESAGASHCQEWSGNGFDGMDERLVRALGELPDEYQTVMLLWAVDELSYKEIAEACDVPIGTVMSRLHRARARLAERLQGYAIKDRVVPGIASRE